LVVMVAAFAKPVFLEVSNFCKERLQIRKLRESDRGDFI
jgi:hypothetical protein